MRVVTVPVETSSGSTVPVVHHETCGIDMAAVAAMAPGFGIAPDQIFFEKVRIFEAECIAAWQNTGCNRKKKERCKYKFGPHLKWACENCEEKN